MARPSLLHSLRLTLLWVRDRWTHERRPSGLAFDRRWQVDTWRWTLGYEPCPVEVVEAVLARLPDDTSAWSFVDLGCGKGRVLLLAAGLPFCEVLGVEADGGLVRVARRNLERLDSCGRRVEVLWADAAELAPPAGDVVVFLYNPFEADVLAEVLRRLEVPPRRVVVAYVNPLHEEVLADRGWTRLHDQGTGTERFVLYGWGEVVPWASLEVP